MTWSKILQQFFHTSCSGGHLFNYLSHTLSIMWAELFATGIASHCMKGTVWCHLDILSKFSFFRILHFFLLFAVATKIRSRSLLTQMVHALEKAEKNSLALNKVIHTVIGLLLLAESINLALGCHTILSYQSSMIWKQKSNTGFGWCVQVMVWKLWFNLLICKRQRQKHLKRSAASTGCRLWCWQSILQLALNLCTVITLQL